MVQNWILARFLLALIPRQTFTFFCVFVHDSNYFFFKQQKKNSNFQFHPSKKKKRKTIKCSLLVSVVRVTPWVIFLVFVSRSSKWPTFLCGPCTRRRRRDHDRSDHTHFSLLFICSDVWMS